MAPDSVNRHKQPDRVISIRMSQQEFKHLQETLKNYGIQRNGLSARVRVLFTRDLYASRRFPRSLEQINRHIEQEKRGFHQAPAEDDEVAEDPEDEDTESEPDSIIDVR